MPIVTADVLLKHAQAKGYAVGSFNVDNLESIEAVLEAATQEVAPVIVALGQGAMKYTKKEYLIGIVKAAATKVDIPVGLLLDHGDREQVLEALDNNIGFSTVMIDASKYPLEENIAITQNIVQKASHLGISVEGELGRIAGVEDHIVEHEEVLCDPGEAAVFARETGVGALAVAIGSAHGMYTWEPKLDFKRLEQIREATDIPLVLHGGSGIPDASIRKAIELGICKINVGSELRVAYVETVKKVLSTEDIGYNVYKLLDPCRRAMQQVVQQKIRLFGASGHAREIIERC